MSAAGRKYTVVSMSAGFMSGAFQKQADAVSTQSATTSQSRFAMALRTLLAFGAEWQGFMPQLK